MTDPGMFWWLLASGIAGTYCLVRAIVDLWQRQYVWAALGLVSGAVLLLTPVQTHAVKIELPANQ